MNIVHRERSVSLTAKQREVLKWLADGKRYEDIAEITHVCRATVASRVKAMMDKLGANTAAGAVAIALRSGIIN